MKSLRLLAAALLISLLPSGAGCGSATPASGDPFLFALADSVDTARMMETIEYMAGEALRGRPSGSAHSQELEAFLVERVERLGLQPVDELELDGYRQEFPVPSDRCFLEDPPPPGTPVTCANILAKIPGASSGEMIVLTANYDGMGVDASSGAIYPGADYNASGASAVLELAYIFSALEEVPEKTLVFAFLGAVECGGYGSVALAEAFEANGLRDSVRIINIEGIGSGEGYYMDV
ncbi:MAG: M28 family peptidase, partial [Actinomycetota bacterium]